MSYFKTILGISLVLIGIIATSYSLSFGFSPAGTDKASESVLTRCVVPGVVSITFDDGPYRYTHGVLDVLAEKEVTATFFVNGANWMHIYNETVQEMIRRAADEGHTIGSHTWSHQNLSSASPDDIRNQMNLLTDALIELELLDTKPAFMRPPFGEFNDQVVAIVGAELGYRIVNWSINTRDWAHPGDTAAGLQPYIDALNGTDPATTMGFITLHHDVQVGSEELAIAVIDYSRSHPACTNSSHGAPRSI